MPIRSKYRSRPAPAAPPPGGRRTHQVLVGLALLVVGATLAVSTEWLVTNVSVPGSQASPGASPSGSAAAVASAAPSASSSPAAPVLEAEMPHAVNGTTLTTESATDATSLGNSPNNRALDAAVTSLGKQPTDLEVAEAYDASGSLALSVLGFRIAGIDPTRLRSLVLDDWLSAGTPGVATSSVSLSGTPSTQVSYGDGGPDEYVFVHSDSLFVVETSDESLATGVVTAMAKASPSPSAGA